MTRRAPKGEPSTFTSSHIKQRLPVIVKRGTRLEGSGPLSVPFSSAPSCHTELCWRDRQWGRGREGGGVEGGGEGRRYSVDPCAPSCLRPANDWSQGGCCGRSREIETDAPTRHATATCMALPLCCHSKPPGEERRREGTGDLVG